MRRLMMKSAVIAGLSCALGGLAFAGNPPGTGQPNQSCETSMTMPGKSASAPGSAFNPTGTAGTVYAGQQPQNSNNPKSVSQYDVACFQQSNKGGRH